MLREKILETRRGYDAFRRLIKADRSMRIIVDEYVRPTPTSRVLDVGCGNADLARMLPAGATYLGLDNNPRYIHDAAARGVNVIEASVSELSSIGYEPFDVVVALGLLHHLDDATVEGLMRDVSEVLVPAGRLVTIDPVLHDGQSLISRTIMRFDRGRHIRDEQRYSQLIRNQFTNADVQVRHDFLPFPYAHCLMTAA
jgi:SAM-dependent methyltransferase